MAKKLVEDKLRDFSEKLASLSDDDITSICNVIRRPRGLVSRRMPDGRNQISVLATKNLKLAAFTFDNGRHITLSILPEEKFSNYSTSGSQKTKRRQP